MIKDLEGKVVLVLGGGSVGPGWGIGKAICVKYAEAGAIVIVADRELSAAQETLALIKSRGGQGRAVEIDVTKDEDLTATIYKVIEALGQVDILYCNVGVGKAGASEQTSPADWRRISDANLTSLHVATSAVLPSMREKASGVILTTSSIAAVRDVGYPHLAYGTTKAAAIHFMRLLAMENACYGIRANTIIAGLIDTPRIEKTLANSYGKKTSDEMRAARAMQCPLGRMGTGFDIAEAALFLASDKASYISGTEILIDGGLSATVQQPPIF
ncbi:MAG TPA: 3-oxoacyl-ACP reductase [Halomonas sp.]|nr:3-oxoacyl-ACP reductase [Halomonas sp.]